MLFAWLKRAAKNAVLDGINEAVAELSGATQIEEPQLPQVRLLLPGPRPEEIEEPKRVRNRNGA